jgi:hypothetical protein
MRILPHGWQGIDLGKAHEFLGDILYEPNKPNKANKAQQSQQSFAHILHHHDTLSSYSCWMCAHTHHFVGSHLLSFLLENFHQLVDFLLFFFFFQTGKNKVFFFFSWVFLFTKFWICVCVCFFYVCEFWIFLNFF